MPLIQDILSICQKYSSREWGAYLKQHFNLDINTNDPSVLANRLHQPLNLTEEHFKIPGFSDLARNTMRAVEPGDPARSLLYHAFASPGVKPADSDNDDNYPTVAELAVLENYVWVASKTGVKPPTMDELKIKAEKVVGNNVELGVVVFSQEYRLGHESSHRKHADMAFSRTGVARVGTKDAHYSRKDRGYWPRKDGDKVKHIHAVPAHYAPYIAVKVKGTDSASFGLLPIQRFGADARAASDNGNSFWVPLHKLFRSSHECVKDVDLSEIALDAHHVNEKLRRIHKVFRERVLTRPTAKSEAETRAAPFFITDEAIATLSLNGEVSPVPQPLVQQAKDNNGQPIAFRLTPGTGLFDTSIHISPSGGSRPAPEFVHIRRGKNGEDLNDETELVKDGRVDRNLLLGTRNQPREAMHYKDSTGDGWVSVKNLPSSLNLTIFPAYSIVSAPDFYPLVSQYEMDAWSILKRNQPSESAPWVQGGPNSLSDMRRAVNTELKRNRVTGEPAIIGEPVFFAGDVTLTAVVSLAIKREGSPFVFKLDTEHPEIHRQPILPDSSAGIFAPGWDTAVDNNHLAAYGLGSPFPEDAKLCAALSGFWPAASPDTTVTFNVTRGNRIVAPMTDEEIKGEKRWDGVQGPTVVTKGNRDKVVYPNYPHIDYVINAEEKKFSLAATADVTTNEYIRRMEVMQKVRDFLNTHNLPSDHKLLSFYNVPGGNRYHFEFARVDEGSREFVTEADPNPRYWIANISDRFALETDANDGAVDAQVEVDPPKPMPQL